MRKVNLLRGDTFVHNSPFLGDLSQAENIYFTAKVDRMEPDSESVFQASLKTGLIFINGQAATPANGSVTITDIPRGTAVIRVEAVETAKIQTQCPLFYDWRIIYNDGTVSTPVISEIVASSDSTRAVA